MWEAAKKVWDECLRSGMKYGYRNAQVTVLAPTGTIGFMMDCDTTGVEPDLALVKYKKLVGGGLIKIVNNTVPAALLKLGYTAQQAREIVNYIDQHGTIEGAPHLKPEHLPVFDCALKPANGKRSIHYMGHVRMMAAVQPFLSGAISKTVNMPDEATVEEIANAYHRSLEAGPEGRRRLPRRLQAHQPLNTSTPSRRRRRKQTASSKRAARNSDGAGRRRRLTAASLPTSGGHHPQVLGGPARRLPDRGLVRGRPARAKSSSPWPRKARRFPA